MLFRSKLGRIGKAILNYERARRVMPQDEDLLSNLAYVKNLVEQAQPAEEHHDGVCCPGTQPGQVCPMHHVREGVRTCAMRGPCSASDAALLSLVGVLGLPPVARGVLDVAPIAEPVSTFADAEMTRSELPESPPPRS